MQIHADSKGKVAVDDVTLWANCCTKCHEHSYISITIFKYVHFYLEEESYSALFVSENLHMAVIL